MPILTASFNETRTNKEGEQIQTPSQLVMTQRGPLLQAQVTLAQSFAAELKERGEEPPEPEKGMVMLDTSAPTTFIDETAANKLGLPAVDVVRLMRPTGASGETIEQNVYPARIELVGMTVGFDLMRAVAAPLHTQGVVALIGRDILSSCVLTYNGPSGQITLAI